MHILHCLFIRILLFFFKVDHFRKMLRFQGQLSGQKTMLLWHGCFGSVEHIINQQLAKGQGLIAAIDIPGFFFINHIKMIPAGMSGSDINIFADFNESVCA